jgi:hypothetical protein
LYPARSIACASGWRVALQGPITCGLSRAGPHCPAARWQSRMHGLREPISAPRCRARRHAEMKNLLGEQGVSNAHLRALEAVHPMSWVATTCPTRFRCWCRGRDCCRSANPRVGQPLVLPLPVLVLPSLLPVPCPGTDGDGRNKSTWRLSDGDGTLERWCKTEVLALLTTDHLVTTSIGARDQ